MRPDQRRRGIEVPEQTAVFRDLVKEPNQVTSTTTDPLGPYAAAATGRRPRARGLRSGPLTWVAVAIAALFSIPVLSILSNLLVPTEGAWSHLASTVLPGYIVNSIYLVLAVGIGVLVIGTATAWLVTMCRFPGRRIFEWALVLPLAVPAYVMAYTYTDFLQFSGPVQTMLRDAFEWGPRDYWFPQIRSVGGAGVMLIAVLYPYVYLLARAAFIEQSVCALEVSRTLGCGAWTSFSRVALPLARPALAGGVTLALMETMADYGTVAFFEVPTFTTGIVRAWFSLGDPVAAGQLASVLLGFVFLVLMLERISRGKSRYHHTSSRYNKLPSYPLKGWRGWGAATVCVVPLTVGFLLPGAILLKMAIEAGDSQFGPRFLRLAFNSFTLAGTSALIAAGLALLLAYAPRRDPSTLGTLANRVACMGYAVPGTVIAVGVLIPFAALDNSIDAWLRGAFGVSSGLLLTGTLAALVFAYLVRFLAVALNTVEASLGKIKPSMDDAARNLGEKSGGLLRRVHVPIMSGGLMTAALLVFVDVMKELPATLVMRPFNFDTLAVQAYNLAADERLTESSSASLTIVAVAILPVILLSRSIAKSRPGGG